MLARLGRLGLAWVALLVTFVALLTLVFSLPNSPIMRSASRSVRLLQAEGLYPAPFGTAGLTPDNFSDALMIDTAIVDEGRTSLERAMAAENQTGRPPGYTIGALADSAAGRRDRPGPYARYWHGYQVLLRPALFFVGYGDIRYLNMIALGALTLAACLVVRSTIGVGGVVAFVLALLLTGFYIVPLSLQLSTDAYLMLVGVIATLELERRDRFDGLAWEALFFIGALTAFADLFTVPLLTLGMPLAALLLLRARKGQLGWRSAAATTVTLSAFWSAGYAMTWASKWAIGSAVLRSNVLSEAAASAATRMGWGWQQMVVALYRNVRYLAPLLRRDLVEGLPGGMRTAVLATAAVLALATVAGLRVARGRRARERMRALTPALVPAALPFLWYLFVSEHSTTHAWFTYRALAITVFAVLAVLLAGFDESHATESTGT